MIHWKLTAGCAGFAVLLSIMAGLFGRVSAGPLIFRALLSGIVFGALSAGLELLGVKYLPELFAGAGAEDTETEDAEPAAGGGVDIVVDDEEPVSYTADDREHEDLSAESAVIKAEDFSDGADDSGVESPADEEYAASEDGGESAEAEDLESVETPAGGKDGLPNIEDLSGSFGRSTGKSAGLHSLGSGNARSSEALDSLGGVDDPATMAQAIRSMVQKDQEG